MFKRIIKILLYSTVGLALAVLLFVWGVLHYMVVLHPGDEIKLENIQAILGKESPVFYSDGVTPLGVFFDDAHRQYVKYEQIPRSFVNSLVAAEDNRFFEHHGFDPVSIGRAVVRNYEAGRVVQGGSTLTQQTAKNLFKRSGRSYEAKLKELVFALRLEHHYSKEQIFEFYANQFYVRGNGHGLGVAARYYFDKKVEDLSLLESAFIAGSVKRPNYYNPFIRKSAASRDEVRNRVNIRVAYVLKQMRQLGMLSEQEYQENLQQEVVFSEGQVGYALDYVMEMVREAVDTETIKSALEEQGISNVATAGLRVVTSVDKDLQKATLYQLRRELSRLDIRLRGYGREEVQTELKKTDYQGDQELEAGAFLFGTVTGSGRLEIEVELDAKLGHGVIDRQGLDRALLALVKWKSTPWTEVKDGDLALLTGELREGDRVWVSVREVDRDNEKIYLDLERYPLLQGGALILRHGMIQAMAGGVENRFYNRALYARRPMGSSFKPYLFAAALQLGWNPADLLQNGRDVFVYQDQPYFPRPDHANIFDKVSINWAGVKSENLASIWLLYHLCDHLSPEEFKDLVRELDLAPRMRNGQEEPYSLYSSRIRDRYGIVLNRDNMRAAAFNLAVRNLETDFLFADREEEYQTLQNLHYGLNFARYTEELVEEDAKELRIRLDTLAHHYLGLADLYRRLQAYRLWLEEDPNAYPVDTAVQLFFDRDLKKYVFTGSGRRAENRSSVDMGRLRTFLAEAERETRDRFWDDVLLDYSLSGAAIGLVENEIEREMQRLAAYPPYSLEVLAGVHDFRVLAGLEYLIRFGAAMGITSQLDPVLSFPLGSNVVTLLETARVYETLVTGAVHLAPADDPKERDLLTVIDRIETAGGEVVYQAEMERTELMGEEPRLELCSILENTVIMGTGSYARKNARLPGREGGDGGVLEVPDLPVPLLGKTGTANDYTNAAFFGFLPAVANRGTGMVIDGGYTIGTYVGFDDNKPMKRKATRITGSSGALPAWTGLVNTLLKEKGYAEELDLVDLTFYGLNLMEDDLGQIRLALDEKNGGRLLDPVVKVERSDSTIPAMTTFGRISASGGFAPSRFNRLFWKNSGHFAETEL